MQTRRILGTFVDILAEAEVCLVTQTFVITSYISFSECTSPLPPSSLLPTPFSSSLPSCHSFTMSSEEGSDEDNGCHDNGREEEFIFELSTEVGEKGGDERERKWEGLSPSPIGRGTACTCSTDMQY